MEGRAAALANPHTACPPRIPRVSNQPLCACCECMHACTLKSATRGTHTHTHTAPPPAAAGARSDSEKPAMKQPRDVWSVAKASPTLPVNRGRCFVCIEASVLALSQPRGMHHTIDHASHRMFLYPPLTRSHRLQGASAHTAAEGSATPGGPSTKQQQHFVTPNEPTRAAAGNHAPQHPGGGPPQRRGAGGADGAAAAAAGAAVLRGGLQPGQEGDPQDLGHGGGRARCRHRGL